MGLLKLLAFPISGPLWVAKVVHDQAERVFYDVGAIREEMADLERRHRTGEIDDEQFELAEEALLERLIQARQYHRRKEQESRDE
jgi:hypothetical protein